jgi:hypothetical protein
VAEHTAARALARRAGLGDPRPDPHDRPAVVEQGAFEPSTAHPGTSGRVRTA